MYSSISIFEPVLNGSLVIPPAYPTVDWRYALKENCTTKQIKCLYCNIWDVYRLVL